MKQNLSPIEAVIFDCDGTLVDSEPITNDVLVDYVAEFGLQLDRANALSLFAGRDMSGIVKVLEGRLGRTLPAHFVDEFRSRQAVALEQRLEPIEGAVDLLRSIELPMFLASNAPREKIAINLRVTGLSEFFPDQRVFSAYDIQVWKPAPDLFLHTAKAARVSPSACAVVEDSAAGLEAAAHAGTQVFCYAPEVPVRLNEDVARLPGIATMQVVQQLHELKATFA